MSVKDERSLNKEMFQKQLLMKQCGDNFSTTFHTYNYF